MTNRDPWVAFFDQAARPSRLVLGKKFFHIWFIYTCEGCVLVLHLFFFAKCNLWNTLLIIYWGPLALMITVACVQVKVLFLKHLDWKPDMLLHVVTYVPSIVFCWDYQHRIRCVQNGQPSLVPVSLLVCSFFKLSRQIVSWHSGISSSLPTIFSTERPWWSNSVLSSTGYKTLDTDQIRH